MFRTTVLLLQPTSLMLYLSVTHVHVYARNYSSQLLSQRPVENGWVGSSLCTRSWGGQAVCMYNCDTCHFFPVRRGCYSHSSVTRVYLHVSPAYRLALFIVLSCRVTIIVGATTSDTRCILIRANVQQIVVTGFSQFVCVFSCACVCIRVCAAGSAPLCHAPRVCPCWLRHTNTYTSHATILFL